MKETSPDSARIFISQPRFGTKRRSRSMKTASWSLSFLKLQEQMEWYIEDYTRTNAMIDPVLESTSTIHEKKSILKHQVTLRLDQTSFQQEKFPIGDLNIRVDQVYWKQPYRVINQPAASIQSKRVRSSMEVVARYALNNSNTWQLVGGSRSQSIHDWANSVNCTGSSYHGVI